MADLQPLTHAPRWPAVIAFVVLGAFVSICLTTGFVAGLAVDRCEVAR